MKNVYPEEILKTEGVKEENFWCANCAIVR